MKLYSERELGAKPRINEEITPIVWKGIVSLLEKFEQKNFFAEEYPEGCGDNPSNIWAVDTEKLNDDLQIYTGLSWPLVTTMEDNDSWISERKAWAPDKYKVFDTLEFLFSKTTTADNDGFYHSYFDHHHLSFKKDGVAQAEFCKQINDLFRATGMIYEFDLQSGHVQVILGGETKELIHNALSFRLLDIEFQEMLSEACTKISHAKLNISYQALEKLWDAYERLKCYYLPENQKEKRDSVQRIVALFSENAVFQAEIDAEMKKLTELGNSFRIRHSETYQFTLTSHRQINYLFKRCLAMIVLIQEQIVSSQGQ